MGLGKVYLIQYVCGCICVRKKRTDLEVIGRKKQAKNMKRMKIRENSGGWDRDMGSCD